MRRQYHTRTVKGERHTWDVHQLLRKAKGLRVEAVPLNEISELDELWWYQTSDDRPTPRSVADHMKLVRDTDLSYPILFCADGRLMDGMHRVVKALLGGREQIKAIRFPETPAPDYINVDPATLSYEEEDI